jgi:class 3 adenylate cyclase/tetratricopeptide (TPR) repeat protein
MQQIADWLKKLGMSEYAQRFAENGIGVAALPHLTDQDLKEIGVLLGHRRIMLAAISELASAAAPVTSQPAAPRAEQRDDAERRQLTVMFTDLVGSTALSTKLDPEDLRSVIGVYHKCVAETVARFDGFVAKYMGDGVLVYFGYPQAHEDDAERAVRAGLALIEAVGKVRAQEPLQVRIGVATGLVVVGDLVGSGEAQERGVVGETPNLAARLQGIAAPNTVVIAEGTRRLLGNLFELQDLGAKDLKGIAASARAWVVLRASSVESRFEALHASGLTALVGREEETELLLRRWARAKTGEGQVVLIAGEAGIGKSRLTAALMERLAAEPHTRLRYFCSPQHTDSALYPIIGQMERAAGLVHEDCPQAKLDKLDAVLAQTSTSIQNATLFAEMLSLPNDGRYPALELSPQQRRERTLGALVLQLEALTRSNPVLMIFEDVHWLDPTSRELLDLIIERVAYLPILLVVTFRPEFQAPWTGQPHVTVITLNRFNRREGRDLVGRVVGNNAISDEIAAEIVERTDGIPLFIEELTKAVLEAGDQDDAARGTVSTTPLPALAVPASLHASLMARLDRLGPVAKEIAQIGAVFGREFSYEPLASVAQRSDADLQAALDRLGDAGLVFRRGAPPKATFLFKHALVRDAAYGSLLRGQRRQLHARIAAVLEGQFPDLVATQPELLAQHCFEANFAQKASDYWLRAGLRAAQRSANVEAIAHLKRGIEAVASIEEGVRRAQQELSLRLALGPALMATRGWSSTEAEETYVRALELCEHLGQQRERFEVLWGLWLINTGVGRLGAARALVDELFSAASSLADDALQMQAHHAGWTTDMWTGEFVSAREHIREGLRIYDPAKHSGQALLYGGHDPAVCAKGQASIGLWLLGYPDQAARSAEEGLALAESLGHVPSLAHALLWKGALSMPPRRDYVSTFACAERLIALGTEQTLALYLAVGTMLRGWSSVHFGHVGDGLVELRRGLDAYIQTSKIFWPYFKAMLAEAQLFGGEAGLGLAALEEGLRITEEGGEVFWQAPMLHLRGELLLRLGRGAEAERSFQQSLAVAARQGAKSAELRASTSLARLWRNEGKCTEARDLLASIYGWFTEGLDTPDVKDAKALLDELT